MGKIFCIMGKSASGKDTLASALLNRLGLKMAILFTTRPMRTGEIQGKNYYFVSQEEFDQLEREGKVIEKRTYQTIHGPWTYATVNANNALDLEKNNYLMLNTLEGYKKLVSFFGQDNVVPIYVWVEFEKRLDRAFLREDQQENPKYKEICRRFLADEKDFSEEKLTEAGIFDDCRYLNDDFDVCLKEIEEAILMNIEKQKRLEMKQ